MSVAGTRLGRGPEVLGRLDSLGSSPYSAIRLLIVSTMVWCTVCQAKHLSRAAPEFAKKSDMRKIEFDRGAAGPAPACRTPRVLPGHG